MIEILPVFVRTVKGAFSLLLRTTVLPAARAGAALPAKAIKGTFHGMMAATTPKGCLRVMLTNPGVLRLEKPLAVCAASAKDSNRLAAMKVSP